MVTQLFFSLAAKHARMFTLRYEGANEIESEIIERRRRGGRERIIIRSFIHRVPSISKVSRSRTFRDTFALKLTDRTCNERYRNEIFKEKEIETHNNPIYDKRCIL